MVQSLNMSKNKKLNANSVNCFIGMNRLSGSVNMKDGNLNSNILRSQLASSISMSVHIKQLGGSSSNELIAKDLNEEGEGQSYSLD